jgi:hypothetical protein
MTVTLDLVAVIFLGWLQPKFFYVPVIFGLPYSKIALRIVKKCPTCQIFQKKARTHPTPLHPIVVVDPFAKWGIDFMQCKPTSARGHGYIIIAVDYFTKWVEAMPTFHIVTDHKSHFQNQMMGELCTKLGFHHENSSPYYPQANGQVEAINKVLKTMLQRMVGVNKTS